MAEEQRLDWRDLLNLAGVLTVARIPLAVVFVFLGEHREWALAVYLMGGATDVVDGFVARRMKTVSRAGAYADGISDKIFHLTVVSSIVAFGWMPAWTIPALLSREIGQLVLSPWFLGRMRRSPGVERKADAMGKATTVLLALSIGLVLADFPRPARAATWATCAAGLVSIASYAWREWRHH